MLKDEKQQLINNIFIHKKTLEKHLLGIVCEDDRVEVMQIFANRIIRLLLKEELNFLYMKDFKDFKFYLVVNILFRELANEWASFAEDVLGCSRDEALKIIHDKERATFLMSTVKGYFKEYKIYFLQEIADTFIELVDIAPNSELESELIKQVIESKFVKDNNVSIIYNYAQLWNRVKNARNNKNSQIAKIQIKLSEVSRENDVVLFNKYEYCEEVLENKPLAYFDDAIMRLRNTMIKRMSELN